MKIHLLILLGLAALTSRAQDFSQDWGNYTNFLDKAGTHTSGRVNEFTGSIGYSFDVYTIAANGASFPVSLDYQSNGIQVDEYASAVGLGWRLNAGGSITKIVRGKEDWGQFGYHNNSVNPVTTENIYEGKADGEKDYFVFSAFGLSGTFFFNEVNNSYEGMTGEKIKVTWLSAQNTFIISDDAGNDYHYTEQETISSSTSIPDDFNNASVQFTQKGNWFLTKVVLLNGQEIIVNYTEKNIQGLKVSFSEISVVPIGSCGAASHVRNFVYNSYSSFKVESIESGTTKISFIYRSNARQDIPDDHALEKIEVKHNGNLFKRYLLSQDYYSSRLMLNKIIDKNVVTGQELELLKFDYNKDYTMPAPVSVSSKDLAGYFNNAPAFSALHVTQTFNSLVPVTQKPGTIGVSDIEEGANRAMAAAAVVQTLMLKKITSLYGKVEEISYEPNSYNTLTQGVNGYVNVETQTFGLRVEKIVSYETAQPSVKRYVKYNYANLTGVCSGKLLTQIIPNILVWKGNTCDRMMRIAESRRTRLNFLDANVVYRHVKTQVYSDPANVQTSTLGYTFNTYTIDSPESITININPTLTNTYLYFNKYKWGKLASTCSYTNTMQLIMRKDYRYQDLFFKHYGGMYVWLTGKDTNAKNQYAGPRYYNSIGTRRLTSVTTHSYNTSGALLSVSCDSLKYDYYGYVTESESYINNVLRHRTTYKRSYNYNVSSAAHKAGSALIRMNERNIFGPVLETVSYKLFGANPIVMNATISLFENDGTHVILPWKALSYKQVTPSSTAPSLSFNSNGEPVYPASYKPVEEATRFDHNKLVIESLSNNVTYSAAHLNDDGAVICAFNNARFEETGFMGFESYEAKRHDEWALTRSNFDIYSTPMANALTNVAFTGTRALNLAYFPQQTAAIEFKGSFPVYDRPYRLRMWHKTNSGSVSVRTNPGGSPFPLKVIKTQGAWRLIEFDIKNHQYPVLVGTGIIDDVLYYPYEASYAYKVYDEKGLLKAESDHSGSCMFYEYDEHYRIKTIKDANNKIIKAYEYGIQEQQ